MSNLAEWLRTGRYLPKAIRDFHRQKDLFKTIHERVVVEKHGYAKNVDWVTGQCYVIDIFLWWMAKHGYVLKKMTKAERERYDTHDLDAQIKNTRDARMKVYAEAMFPAAKWPTP